MKNKVIGIYMPTHNRLALLKKAVESVLTQTYQNFKLVIVDDGSTDGTLDYLKGIEDSRIEYIHHSKPKGACISRNRAIKKLDAELITGLDDDDEFLPNRLQSLIDAYDPKFSFVCSGYYWNYGAHKKALFNKDKIITLSDAFDLNQCSNQILVEKSRLLAVGGFDESLPALQDHDLWIRLISSFGSANRIGTPLYIVNDDLNLQRISSVENKLKAIDIFEKKHSDKMYARNLKNLQFYKRKILGDSFTLLDLIKSAKYGLLKLKLRLFLSHQFKSISNARLNYLRTGSISKLISYLYKALVGSPIILILMLAVMLLSYLGLK